jgi:hypothetical protein
VISAAQLAQCQDSGQRQADSIVTQLVLSSEHMACLVCPLCGRMGTEDCAVCRVPLCPSHDVACHVAGDAICETCWRSN